jgi:hypothetical protein
MGHSIQIYKEKTTVINDLDLLVIMGFGTEIIRQSSDFAKFTGLDAHWQKSIAQYGPGVINLKLAQFITTPDEIQSFRALLSATLERGSQHGKAIPAFVLNELLSASRVRFGDYGVSYIEEAIKKLLALFADN